MTSDTVEKTEKIIYKIGNAEIRNTSVPENYHYVIKTDADKEFFKFNVSCYSETFAQGLDDYCTKMIRFIEDVLEQTNMSSTKNLINSLNDYVVNAFVDHTNSNEFVKQYKDDVFTREMIVEFLLRNTDYRRSLTNTEISDLVQLHIEKFPRNHMFIQDDGRDVERALQYFIPMYSDYENLFSLILNNDAKDLTKFSQEAINIIVKIIDCEYSLEKAYSRFERKDKLDTRVQDYIADVYKHTENIKNYKTSCLQHSSVVKLFNNLTMREALKLYHVIPETLSDESYVLNLIKDIDNGDYATEINLVAFQSINNTVNVNANTGIICTHIDSEFSAYQSYITNFYIDYYNSKAYEDDTTVYDMDFLNIMINLEKSVCDKNYNFLVYLIKNKVSLDELCNIILDCLENEVSINADQWINYANHYDEFKNMPVSWWRELV